MKKLIGGVLLAMGIIIATASGVCSIAVLVSGLSDQSGSDSMLSFLPAVALFGGIPLAIGVGLFFVGRGLVREDARPRIDARPDEPPPSPPNP